MSPVAHARPDAAAHPVTAQQVRRWLRTRQVRQARERWSRDGFYTVALSVIFLVVTAGAAVRGYLLHAGDGGPASGVAVTAVGLASVAILLLAAGAAGPLSLSPAALSWVATSPIRRAELLRPHYLAALCAGLVAGFPTAVLALPGQSGPLARSAVVLLALAAGVTVAAITVLVQTSAGQPGRILRAAASLCGLGAVVVGFAGSLSGVALPLIPSTVVMLVLAVVAVVVAAGRLDATRIATLRASSSSVLAITGGVASGDPGLLSRVAEDRRWERQPLRLRVRLRAGPRALVSQDLITVLRMPSRAVLALAIAVLPGLLGEQVSSPAIRVAGWLAAGLIALSQVTGNSRYDTDRPGLARLLGLTDQALLRRRAVVPTLFAVVWSAVATGLLTGVLHHGIGWGIALGIAAAPALAAGALRSSRRSFVRHDYPLIVTPEGVIPSGPLLWTVQAFDLALIGTLPTLITIGAGFHPGPVAMVAQVVASALVLAGFLTASTTFQGGRRATARARWILSRTVTTIWRV
jgi:Family of unknown function (DUF6297)